MFARNDGFLGFTVHEIASAILGTRNSIQVTRESSIMSPNDPRKDGYWGFLDRFAKTDTGGLWIGLQRRLLVVCGQVYKDGYRGFVVIMGHVSGAGSARRAG